VWLLFLCVTIDPILPGRIYAGVLEKMLIEIEQMADPSSAVPATLERIIFEAEGHLLNSLLGWGPTAVLSEYVRLYQQQVDRDPRFSAPVRALEESLLRRKEQTSAGYLKFRTAEEESNGHLPGSSGTQLHCSVERKGALYDIDEVLSIFGKRISRAAPGLLTSTAVDAKKEKNSRVALDAAAKLSMMNDSFDEALRFFLMIGAHHPTESWVEMEDEAIAVVNSGDTSQKSSTVSYQRDTVYAYVISIIEAHHLHQYLLNSAFIFEGNAFPPLFALLRLVGLDLLGDFLIEHCVAPQSKRSSGESPSDQQLHSDKAGGERRGTLPIDLVARQFSGSPKLLHWYLHLVFTRKPSVYVVFPLTSLPPPVITSLHRQHIDLYIRFAGEYRDSARALEGIEAYRVSEFSTPFQAFLKVRND
jgi:hypothetical protein